MEVRDTGLISDRYSEIHTLRVCVWVWIRHTAIMLWKAAVGVLLPCHNAVCVSEHTAEWKHYLGDKALPLFLYLSLYPSLFYPIIFSSFCAPSISYYTMPVVLYSYQSPSIALSLCPGWMSFCQPVVISPAASLLPSFSFCNSAERLMSDCMQSEGRLNQEKEGKRR